MTIKEALQKVVSECPDPYAKTYAQAGLDLGGAEDGEVINHDGGVEIRMTPTGDMMEGEELRVQLLYVLTNMSHWRGEAAKEVRKTLKDGSC